jgi:hypothetical protein
VRQGRPLRRVRLPPERFMLDAVSRGVTDPSNGR